MARAADRLAENVPGDFYVDASCIDCDTCRWVAPEVFAEGQGTSYVRAQPASAEAERRALMALVACPTASIGVAGKHDVRAAARAFPEPITDGVSYCGYAAESSFGASAYLIQRPGGNVLVDSPRASKPLIRRLEELGGVALMFLTHQDDVADHAELARHFGCRRVMHEADVSARTRAVEQQLRGRDPVALADDLLVIPVPGHTRGSAALLYREEVLFTGDHLWWDGDLGRLDASHGVCWYSWREQLASLARLQDHRFEWVLPGHGRRHHATSPDAMRAELGRTLAALV